MLRHLSSRITYISHISLQRLVFAYSIFFCFQNQVWFIAPNFKLRNKDLDPEEKQWTAITNYILGCRDFFSCRFSRVRLETSFEWGFHYPALHRLRWAPVINQWVQRFILTILGEATELRHLQGRKIKVSVWIHLEAAWTSMPKTNSETDKGIFKYNDKHTGRDYWQRSLQPDS